MTEEENFKRSDEFRKHIDAGDLAQYVSDLMDQTQAGKTKLYYLDWTLHLSKELIKDYLIPVYKERIEKHRSSGDLRNYFFGVFFRDEICASNFFDNKSVQTDEVVYIRENIERLLTPSEKKECKMLAMIAESLRRWKEVFAGWNGEGIRLWQIRNFLCKLSKTPKNSKDYELYNDIRERQKADEKIYFDKQIKKQKMLNILVPAVAAAVLILFGVFFVITM